MKQLGHYIVIEKLGGGSGGVVYRAQDRRQGRIVALKVIQPKNKKATEQFERELQASRQLVHPNIATLESIELLDDGQLLIVIPFLAGKTLDKMLVPISFERALDIIRQTALGLEYAHARGIIHCDIKPANLMLSKGHLKILDFGLSRVQDEEETGLPVGTLEYMSPEAARGQKLGFSSDLWSLGVVWYELLTGQSPFQAATIAATLHNIATLEPPAISQVRSDIPESTDSVLDTLLSKQKTLRYEHVQEFLRDLEALQEGKMRIRPQGQLRKPLGEKVKTPLVKLPDKPEILLGRDDELALISLYLQDPECRLLTLQGMGGIGKTHLSLWASHAQLHFEKSNFDFIHFVALAAVNAAGFIAALAEALDIEHVTLDALTRTIGKRKQLLVLDNFEHLSSRAFILERLLESCPNLTLFITTRERLALDAEWVIPLQGLGVPASIPAPDDVHYYAALAFFEYCARKQDTTFNLNTSLESVYGICLRLQGHPLGIALAAAMLKQLPVQEVEKKLSSFEWLEHGSGRHSNLRAVFEQSYSLLSLEQQNLLASISLFEDGFELDAAQSVVGATASMLDDLLDRSLLEQSMEGRYIQHPVLHSFCQEKRKGLDTLSQHYQAYFTKQLQSLRVMLRGTEQSRAFEKLERDFANMRSVIEQNTEDLLPDIAEPFRAFYTHKGRYAEGWELFSRARGQYARACAGWFALLMGNIEDAEAMVAMSLQSDDQHIRLLWLNTRAGILVRGNHIEKARELSLETFALAQYLDDLPMITASMTNLAMLEEWLGNMDASMAYYQRVLELSEKTQNHAQTITILNNLADLHLNHQNVEKAKALLERALLVSAKHKLSRMKPLLQSNFGLCLYAQGDYVHAEAAYLEAYQAALEHGDEIEAVSARIYLGQVVGVQGHHVRARHILLESLAMMQTLDYTPGKLSAIVRLAEILKTDAARSLAAMVFRHPHTETGDRKLAERLAQGTVTTLTLGEALRQLAQSETLRDMNSPVKIL